MSEANTPEIRWESRGDYYDIKTAISAICKAEKLKPEDPLIHRSAAMIYAAVGDFKTAKKHL